jgi:hypothetical protein
VKLSTFRPISKLLLRRELYKEKITIFPASVDALEQWCSTLEPFATRGNNNFKCGKKQLFRNRFVRMINNLQYKVATVKPLSPHL